MYPPCITLKDSCCMVVSRRKFDDSALAFVSGIRLKCAVLKGVAIEVPYD